MYKPSPEQQCFGGHTLFTHLLTRYHTGLRTLQYVNYLLLVLPVKPSNNLKVVIAIGLTSSHSEQRS